MSELAVSVSNSAQVVRNQAFRLSVTQLALAVLASISVATISSVIIYVALKEKGGALSPDSSTLAPLPKPPSRSNPPVITPPQPDASPSSPKVTTPPRFEPQPDHDELLPAYQPHSFHHAFVRPILYRFAMESKHALRQTVCDYIQAFEYKEPIKWMSAFFNHLGELRESCSDLPNRDSVINNKLQLERFVELYFRAAESSEFGAQIQAFEERILADLGMNAEAFQTPPLPREHLQQALQESPQIVASDFSDFDESTWHECTTAIFKKHDFVTSESGYSWQTFSIGSPAALTAAENQWKVFINPKAEHFHEVLDRTLRVVKNKVNIQGKIVGNPLHKRKSDLPQIADPCEPKIIIDLNGDDAHRLTKEVIEELDKEFGEETCFLGAPKGERNRNGHQIPQWGPSFTRKYSRLLYYTQGGFTESGRNRALHDGTLAEQFEGENYFLFSGYADPMEGQRSKHTAHFDLVNRLSTYLDIQAEINLLKEKQPENCEQKIARLERKLTKFLKLSNRGLRYTLVQMLQRLPKRQHQELRAIFYRTCYQILGDHPNVKVMKAPCVDNIKALLKTRRVLDKQPQEVANYVISRVAEFETLLRAWNDARSFCKLFNALPEPTQEVVLILLGVDVKGSKSNLLHEDGYGCN